MKSKLFIILSAFLLCINIFVVSSFASVSFNFEGADYSLDNSVTENFSYYFVLRTTTSYYLTFASNSPFIMYEGISSFTHKKSMIVKTLDGSNFYTSYLSSKPSSNVELEYNTTNMDAWTSSFDFVYSNANIVDDNGNMVFQVAPVTVEQVTIPEITQVEEIPHIMNKVLEMIIPIGLIVFFVGLLIYLVRLVILRMT